MPLGERVGAPDNALQFGQFAHHLRRQIRFVDRQRAAQRRAFGGLQRQQVGERERRYVRPRHLVGHRP